MKTLKDPVFEPETLSEKIADFIGSFLLLFFIALIFMAILAFFTIIGYELASAIWGDYRTTYWLADLF